MKISRKDAYGWATRNWMKFAAAAIALVLLSLISGISVASLTSIIALVLIASFSTFYFNYVNAPVNFELVKMATILVAYTQGIVAGIIVGVLSTLLGKVLIGRIDEKIPISAGAITLVAVLAGVFSGADITMLGILLVGFYNIAMFTISMAMGGDLGWNIPYEGTNFAINFILFTRVAPLLLPLLQ